MRPRLKNYMRTHRRQAGFTQHEMAKLVGCGSSTQISRYETMQRQPSLHVLIAYAVIFSLRSYDIYPAIFHEAELLVELRARDLYEELQGIPTQRHRAKLDALEALLRRLEEQSDQRDV